MMQILKNINLTPWLLLILMCLLSYVLWLRLDSVGNQLDTANKALVSINASIEKSNTLIRELELESRKLKISHNSLIAKADKLEQSNETIKKYLDTPVPSESARLLNEARTGKAK